MKDQTTKQASASQKPNILVRLLALLVTAALALGALTLVVYRDQFNLDAVKRWLALRSVETDASGAAAPFTHAGGDSISFAYLKGGILQCSAAGAHYYSFSGDQYAEEVPPLSQPVLSASSSAGVVYDAGGESLFLFQDGQEAFSLDVDGTLLSARVNDSGWLAVTAQQSGYKGSVTVYNVNSTSRKEIIQLNFSSVFVADAAVRWTAVSPPPPSPWATWRCWTWTMRRSSCGFWGRTACSTFDHERRTACMDCSCKPSFFAKVFQNILQFHFKIIAYSSR